MPPLEDVANTEDEDDVVGLGEEAQAQGEADDQAEHTDPLTRSVLDWMKTGDCDAAEDDYPAFELLAATSSLTVVPTYVDYDACVYAHVIYDG